MFYRFQLGTHFQLSPGGQVYIFPSRNPKRDLVGLILVRFRTEF